MSNMLTVVSRLLGGISFAVLLLGMLVVSLPKLARADELVLCGNCVPPNCGGSCSGANSCAQSKDGKSCRCYVVA